MTLPLFSPADRPGPDFVGLLRRLGHDPLGPRVDSGSDSAYVDTHATTIVSLRYADGVVMAGDRRATAFDPGSATFGLFRTSPLSPITANNAFPTAKTPSTSGT